MNANPNEERYSSEVQFECNEVQLNAKEVQSSTTEQHQLRTSVIGLPWLVSGELQGGQLVPFCCENIYRTKQI